MFFLSCRLLRFFQLVQVPIFQHFFSNRVEVFVDVEGDCVTSFERGQQGSPVAESAVVDDCVVARRHHGHVVSGTFRDDRHVLFAQQILRAPFHVVAHDQENKRTSNVVSIPFHSFLQLNQEIMKIKIYT